MIKIGFASSDYCSASCGGYIYNSICYNECPSGTVISGSICIADSPSSKVLDLIKGIYLLENINSIRIFDYKLDPLLAGIPIILSDFSLSFELKPYEFNGNVLSI